MAHPQTLGVVLAGGLARRMGGGDKASIRIGGTTVLDRVIERLKPQCARVILNVNADPERFAATGLPVVADSVPVHPGPLAGILAGLDWAAKQTDAIDWIVSVPSDCPFLPHDLIARLHQARIDSGAALACASSGARTHPVVGLWPQTLREDLRHALTQEGVRKVGAWTTRYRVAIAEWPAAPVDPFFNINTPEQAAEAQRLSARFPDA